MYKILKKGRMHSVFKCYKNSSEQAILWIITIQQNFDKVNQSVHNENVMETNLKYLKQ